MRKIKILLNKLGGTVALEFIKNLLKKIIDDIDKWRKEHEEVHLKHDREMRELEKKIKHLSKEIHKLDFEMNRFRGAK